MPGVKQVGGYVALLQTLTYAACGLLEMTVMSDKRKGSLKDYALLCTLTQGGMLFTNWYAARCRHLLGSRNFVCGVGRWST